MPARNRRAAVKQHDASQEGSTMSDTRNWLDAQGIRQRADEVRAGWSDFDRMLRMGLPPDIPGKLHRQLVLLHALERQNVAARRARRMQIRAAVSIN